MTVRVSIDSPQVHAISAELHRVLADHGGSNLWLAVDGADQPLPEIDGIEWGSRECVDVRLPHPDIDPQWWPKWFPLKLDKAEDAHILNHSIVWALEEITPERLRAGMGRRVSGWFTCAPHNIDAAARLWANNMVRRVPQAPGSALLRLHDPAVLWSVWQILSEEQKRQSLGPLTHWHLIDPLGGALQLAPVDGAHPTSFASPGLSGEQWQDINAITPLHQTLLQMTTAGPPSMVEYRQWFKAGLQALRRAKQNRLTDPDSLRLFAQLALTCHPQFDAHPDLQRILKQRQADEPLGGLLCDFTQTDWQRMASELGRI